MLSNKLYNYCHSHSFNEFIIDTCVNNKFDNKIHFFPQTSWILTHENKIVTKLIKIENLNEDLSKLLNEEINLININSSHTKNYNIYDRKLKDLVYEKYKLDFILLGYNI